MKYDSSDKSISEYRNHITLNAVTAKQERISRNDSDQNVNVAQKNPRMCLDADFFNRTPDNVFILPFFSGSFF